MMDQPTSSNQHTLEEEEAVFRIDVHKFLVETGERDRLMEKLRGKLRKSGWTTKVVHDCKDVMDEVGIDNLNLDKLMERVYPKARDIVPNEVRQEILNDILDSLEKKFKFK